MQILRREKYHGWRKLFSTFVCEISKAVEKSHTVWDILSSEIALTSIEAISVGRPERGASFMLKSPEWNLVNHF